jgi:hypothetical protein
MQPAARAPPTSLHVCAANYSEREERRRLLVVTDASTLRGGLGWLLGGCFVAEMKKNFGETSSEY